MIRVKKINDVQIKPVKFITGGGDDKRPVKGSDMFPEIYSNIFILAKKKSGKSNAVYNIIKNCASKDTNVLVFSSTVNKDQIHVAIKQLCKIAKIPYTSYTSIIDDSSGEKINIIEELIHKLQLEAENDNKSEDSDDIVKEKHPLILFEDSDDEDEKKAKKKSKYRAPEYIIVIDDLSNELKGPIINRLLKFNRHFKMKVIISTQYVHDLKPEALKQMDYCLIFKGERKDKLEKLHKDLDLALNFDTFLEIYYNATDEKYQFLYIDVRNEEYRKNFNKQFDMKHYLKE
jgi:hypothetical protein